MSNILILIGRYIVATEESKVMTLQISHGGEGYVLLHESVLQRHSIYLRKSSKGVSGFCSAHLGLKKERSEVVVVKVLARTGSCQNRLLQYFFGGDQHGEPLPLARDCTSVTLLRTGHVLRLVVTVRS